MFANPRVVHLSNYDIKGGAARSAWRLHEGLRKVQVDSRMLVRSKSSDSKSVTEAPPLGAIPRRFWNLIQKNYIDGNRTPLSDTWFSTGYPGQFLHNHEMIRNADIIHLHWISHFQSTPAIATLCHVGKPVVWTLHDQRPFTGGCHFSAGCSGFEKNCNPCPQLRKDPQRLPSRNLSDQCELLPADQITVVTPGKWMREMAARSALFAHSRIEVIPYGIDTDAFSPLSKSEARSRLAIPVQTRCILFGADSSEKRKGSSLLAESFRHLLNNVTEPLQLLCFGRKDAQFEQLDGKVQFLGYLRSDEELRTAYSAADAFILPSLEDNLPNTMLESLACGTPVIGFEVGGIPDVVENRVTGRLAIPGDTRSLSGAIQEILQNPEDAERMGAEGARRMKMQYSLSAQASRYVELYRSLTPGKVLQQKPSSALGIHLRAAIGRIFLTSLARHAGLTRK